MKHLVAILLLAAAGHAQAQFKCTDAAGSVSFQDAPCETGVRSEPLALPRSAAGLERPEHIREALGRGSLVPGMTRAEVRQVMRVDPDVVNTSVYENRTTHQLVYRQRGRTIYVYLEDDVVTSASASERADRWRR